MWIDIHAHLYDKSDLELTQVLENAEKNNVDIIVNTPTSIDTTQKVIEQIHNQSSLYGTAGISSFDVENLPDNWERTLNDLLTHDKIIGVGEIGLDKSNPRYPSFDMQLPVFEQQLAIAYQNDIPVVIHSRGAEKEVIDLCKNHSITKAIFHCFTGSKKALKQLLDEGYSVSFSGIVTYKNNPLESLVRYTPMEQLFIETDTPYLAPEPYRGKPNEPAHVALVGEKIAEIKGLTIEQTAEQIRYNLSNLFKIPISDR